MSSNPWDRLPDETDAAWRAFCIYRDLGPKRTVSEAYRNCYGKGPDKEPPKFFRKWAKRYDWKRRAAAYDNRLTVIEVDEARKRIAAEIDEWVSREKELRRAAYDRALALLSKAEEMLAFPIVERVTERDGRTIIIKPMRWRAGDIAKLAEAAERLARLALDMREEAIDVDAREVDERRARVLELMKRDSQAVATLVESLAGSSD